MAGLFQLIGGPAWRTASGVVGLVLAAVAASVAGVVVVRARSRRSHHLDTL